MLLRGLHILTHCFQQVELLQLYSCLSRYFCIQATLFSTVLTYIYPILAVYTLYHIYYEDKVTYKSVVLDKEGYVPLIIMVFHDNILLA